MRRGVAKVGVAAVALIAAVSVNGEIRSDGFKVGPGATEGGSVACKDGKVPVGGGFTLEQSLNPPERLVVHSAYPAGKRWKVEAYSLDGVEKRGSAIVVCSKGDGVFVRSKAKQVPEGTDGAQATARCPAGSKALGGGGKGPGANQRMRGSFPAGDGRSWGARFELVSGDRIEAFVVCDRSPKDLKIVQDSVTSDPDVRSRGVKMTVKAEAKCPRGADPVGGGQAGGSSAIYRESRPVDGAWRVRADAAEGDSVTAYAVCQK